MKKNIFIWGVLFSISSYAPCMDPDPRQPAALEAQQKHSLLEWFTQLPIDTQNGIKKRLIEICTLIDPQHTFTQKDLELMLNTPLCYFPKPLQTVLAAHNTTQINQDKNDVSMVPITKKLAPIEELPIDLLVNIALYVLSPNGYQNSLRNIQHLWITSTTMRHAVEKLIQWIEKQPNKCGFEKQTKHCGTNGTKMIPYGTMTSYKNKSETFAINRTTSHHFALKELRYEDHISPESNHPVDVISNIRRGIIGATRNWVLGSAGSVSQETLGYCLLQAFKYNSPKQASIILTYLSSLPRINSGDDFFYYARMHNSIDLHKLLLDTNQNPLAQKLDTGMYALQNIEIDCEATADMTWVTRAACTYMLLRQAHHFKNDPSCQDIWHEIITIIDRITHWKTGTQPEQAQQELQDKFFAILPSAIDSDEEVKQFWLYALACAAHYQQDICLHLDFFGMVKHRLDSKINAIGNNYYEIVTALPIEWSTITPETCSILLSHNTGLPLGVEYDKLLEHISFSPETLTPQNLAALCTAPIFHLRKRFIKNFVKSLTKKSLTQTEREAFIIALLSVPINVHDKINYDEAFHSYALKILIHMLDMDISNIMVPLSGGKVSTLYAAYQYNTPCCFKTLLDLGVNPNQSASKNDTRSMANIMLHEQTTQIHCLQALLNHPDCNWSWVTINDLLNIFSTEFRFYTAGSSKAPEASEIDYVYALLIYACKHLWQDPSTTPAQIQQLYNKIWLLPIELPKTLKALEDVNKQYLNHDLDNKKSW